MKKHLEQLLVSKVRIKLLKYFFTHIDEPIHLRAVVREVKEEVNAVRRELERMEKMGLLLTEKKGNRKIFQLNRDFGFVEELAGLVFKSFGIGAEIIAAQRKLGDYKFVVATQGLISNRQVGKHKIDFVVIGDKVNMPELKKLVEKLERDLGRDIYYAVLSVADFDVRKKRKDMFVQELLLQEYLVLLGQRSELLQGIGV